MRAGVDPIPLEEHLRTGRKCSAGEAASDAQRAEVDGGACEAGADEDADGPDDDHGHGLAQSRVSTSVRTLAGRSWVTTAADPADGRKTLVDVTEAIRTAGEQRRTGRAHKTLTNALAGADEKERATLIAALARLHELLVADHTPRRFPDTVTPRTVRQSP
jgi:hypothetical protein